MKRALHKMSEKIDMTDTRWVNAVRTRMELLELIRSLPIRRSNNKTAF